MVREVASWSVVVVVLGEGEGDGGVVVGGGGDGWAESSGVTVGSRWVVAEVVGAK